MRHFGADNALAGEERLSELLKMGSWAISQFFHKCTPLSFEPI